jgi:hypothetical protein
MPELQSVPRIRGPSPIPECSDTGLMPECQFWRHLPRCQCPTMFMQSANHIPDGRRSFRRFDRVFRPPASPYLDEGGGFPVAALHPPPSSVGNMMPYHHPFLLAPDGHVSHPHGKDVPGFAKKARYTNTSTSSLQRYRYPTAVSPTSTSTWLASCNPRAATLTYLGWLEAIPLPSITAADCARALFASWISRVGGEVPPAVEGRPEVQGCRRQLTQSPPVGDVGYSSRLPGGQGFFPC